MAIGDALGMPVPGWSAVRIADRLGWIDGYRLRVMPDGTEISPGEITDETEFALAIVEALTTNQGRLEADTLDGIGSRLLYLLRSESVRWLGEETRAALERSTETLDFRAPLSDDGPATGDVAARGVPIGLLHAVGRFDPDALRRDAEAVTRLTHGGPAAIAATTAVAYGVMLAARGEVASHAWLGDTARFLGTGELAAALGRADLLAAADTPTADLLRTIGTEVAATQSVPAAFIAAVQAETFADAVLTAVNAGGATDTVGAIAGALAGAVRGDTGIPQSLINDLGCRIYVSLAGPWFYRTALQRAGLLIDLRPDGDRPPPRPMQPPRV